MTVTSPNDASASELEHVSGEIVREQTVRAPIPVAPTVDTVRTSAPTTPTADTVKTAPPTSDAPREQTVRAPAPTPPMTSTELEVEPLAEPVMELEPLEIEAELEVEPEVIEVEPEVVQTPKRRRRKRKADRGPTRDDPPAVSGDISVPADEPEGFGSGGRGKTLRVGEVPTITREGSPGRGATLRDGEVPKITREDPPAVSGEVAVDPAARAEPPVADAQRVAMTSSGPNPALNPGAFQRPTTDPGSATGPTYAEITGPQPVAQAETTGPHSVISGGHPATRAVLEQEQRDHKILWIFASTLLLLALGVVAFVVAQAG